MGDEGTDWGCQSRVGLVVSAESVEALSSLASLCAPAREKEWGAAWFGVKGLSVGVVLPCGWAAGGGWLVTKGLRESTVYLMCHGALLEYLFSDTMTDVVVL